MKRVWMAVAILCVCAASAQAQPLVNGMGLSVGVVDVDNMDSTNLTFGIFADMGMAALPFSIQPYVDYWSHSEDMVGGEYKMRDIALGARALYNLGLPNPVVKPFLGAGIGMHFLKAESPAVDLGGGTVVPSFSASDEKLGLDLGGGIGFNAGAVTLRGEGWYTLVSDANMMGARASVIIPFGI